VTEVANGHYVRIHYTTDGEPFDDYFSMEVDGRYIDGVWSDMTAKEVASNYYHGHDGWERSDWSDGVHFTLWRENGERIADFDVHMEMTPNFSAYAKEPA
jgi:hypothetical protein